MADGTVGDDFLLGSTAADVSFGFDGNDLILGFNAPFSGLPQSPSIVNSFNVEKRLSGNDTLSGGAGSDGIYGGDGNDRIFGGDGNDDQQPGGVFRLLVLNGVYQFPTGLYGGDGNDIIDGGNGSDTLFGNLGNDTLIGGDDVDTDFLFGELGNDRLIGFFATDRFAGGSGIDTVVLKDATAVQTDLDGSQPFKKLAGPGEDNPTVENIIVNNTAANFLVGSSANNLLSASGTLQGQGGNDTLVGRASKDDLFGGVGNDVLEGAGGRDNLFGDVGTDTASYFNSRLGVRVSLDGSVTKTNDAAGDLLDQIENLSGSNRGADRLVGNKKNNVLSGNGGNDTLEGKDGNDTLIGGAGRDVLNGGLGEDIASYEKSKVAVSVNMLTPSLNRGEATGDSYKSIEWVKGSNFSDKLTGSNASNILSGLNGNDTLRGLDGSDSLNGNNGKDVLFGGKGADFFRFIEITGFGDKIMDYSQSEGDTIVLARSAFVGFDSSGDLAAGVFRTSRSSNAAQGLDERLTYRTTDNTLWYDSNGSASGGTKVMVADLQSGALLSETDFFIV
jgi:Ca2+-binding RTX toxin-like protein